MHKRSLLWVGATAVSVPPADATGDIAGLFDLYLRLGELMLAARSPGEAIRAAGRSVSADPTSEAAYRLLARAHLAYDEASSARRALEHCRQMLEELGARMDRATVDLPGSLRHPG